MEKDLGALFQLLDCQLKESNLEEDRLNAFACTLAKQYENQRTFICGLECMAHVGLEEDEMGNALIPEDLPSATEKSYKAVKTTGDGDCLYNAVSLTLVGNESYSTLLQLLVALELVLHVNFYAQHPKFTYFTSGGRHPNTVFSLCLTRSSNNVFHDTNQNRTASILSEARVASKPKPKD